MATSIDYVEFVCDQIEGVGAIRFRKMFGEYMVYVNDKPVLLVCDNTVFVKKAENIKGYMQDAEVGFPYNGAKEHYLLDVEDTELAKTVVGILETTTPVPKPRKKPVKRV